MRHNKLYTHILVSAVVVCVYILITITVSVATTDKVNALMLPNMNDWKAKKFSGETSYELVNIDNKQAIRAISNQSASGLIRKIKVDLTKTPYMNWSWKIDSILNGIDETKKSGDDYAARVYVVISGGVFFWRTRAISYTWASKQLKNSSWSNAYTDKATMVAVQSGPELTGQWITEKRNILDDIVKLLGINKNHINAVAIMTDTDNSKQSATAYYGDIYFTAE